MRRRKKLDKITNFTKFMLGGGGVAFISRVSFTWGNERTGGWFQLLNILQDMIHIADTKVARRYGDFFIRQIHKFEEVGIAITN